ncbi:TetR family transcriptional regulator [Streptomyces sp. 2A115]|uniref:TetR family transcriptional regulator n=1 Tax=Streptomyces sp. 2A115 TaxID=3457439 RepID=UPI003FD1375E
MERSPVPRYAKEYTQVTRQRIIERADRRLKQDGTDGSGTSTLRSDAGLTNGAFYAHFASTDDLASAASTEEPRKQAARYGTLSISEAGGDLLGQGNDVHLRQAGLLPASLRELDSDDLIARHQVPEDRIVERCGQHRGQRLLHL